MLWSCNDSIAIGVVWLCLIATMFGIHLANKIVEIVVPSNTGWSGFAKLVTQFNVTYILCSGVRCWSDFCTILTTSTLKNWKKNHVHCLLDMLKVHTGLPARNYSIHIAINTSNFIFQPAFLWAFIIAVIPAIEDFLTFQLALQNRLNITLWIKIVTKKILILKSTSVYKRI